MQLVIRIFRVDGLDEVYIKVIKSVMSGGTMYIYTSLDTYKMPVEEILFTQTWMEETE
jgi:hypothetical protein